VANIRQRAGISLQLLKEIKGFKNDAKVATALAALTKDKDIEVLRSMGQKRRISAFGASYCDLVRCRGDAEATTVLCIHGDGQGAGGE
jgi:hypothetical protein